MGENYVDLLKNLKKGTYFIPKSANISQEAINLIESCLQYDPEVRASWEEIENHRFFTYQQREYKKQTYEHIKLLQLGEDY